MAKEESACESVLTYAAICEETRRRDSEEFKRKKEMNFKMAMPEHMEDIVNEAKKMYRYHRQLNKHRVYLKEMTWLIGNPDVKMAQHCADEYSETIKSDEPFYEASCSFAECCTRISYTNSIRSKF